MGVSAGDLTLDHIHTAYKHICLQGTGCVSVKNYPPEIMQPSSSTRATILSAENQNGATIVKATFFFCHYYIAGEPNNAGEARGQSWNASLKSRWIPGGSCGYTSGTKRKHFAALYSPRPCWRWLQLQPSCGSPPVFFKLFQTHADIYPNWKLYNLCMKQIFSLLLMARVFQRTIWKDIEGRFHPFFTG